MNTKRRRIIYMTDEEWALLKAHAQEHGRSISEVIRDMWTLAAKTEPAGPAEAARITEAAAVPKVKMGTVTQRPKISVDPGPLVDSGTSFRQFNPAPKTGKKK